MTTLTKWITEHSKTRIAMKKLTYIIAIATSVLAMASCQKEQNVTNSDDLTVVSFSTSEIQTKTAFGDKTAEGKYPTLWTGNEKVGVAYNGSVYKGNITSSTDGKSASFEIAIAQDANATNHNFYVISPADAFLSMNKDGAKGHIKIETTQTPGEGTCDPAAQVIAASHKSETFDTQINLAFSHVTAYGNLSIVLPEEAGAVSNISLTGSKNIAGRFYYDFNGSLEESTASSTISLLTSKVSDIFFACAPADLSGGKLDITVTTENGTYEKSIDLTGKTLKFESGIISKFTVNGFAKKEAPASWIATDLADITATDEVVITMAKGGKVYAMTSDNGTKNPQAVLVTVKDGELSATPADNLVWNIANDDGHLTIYPNGQTDKWLYSAASGTDVKVGNSTTNNIFTLDATTKYLKNTGANRYLGVYNNADWRCYTSTSTNIGGQTLCFYVKGGPIDNTRPTLSVDQNSKVWAADATDAFVVKVTVNSEGGDWTVTPETLSWATVAVDKAAGTITVTPNGANETKTANEATLTVTHASDASLTKEISLKQNGVGGETAKTYTLTFANSYGDTGTNNYTTSWEATRDGFTWKMVNWNNNNYNNNWTYVKAGPKGNTNAHAKIETAAAIPEAISKISITIDEVKNGSITSIVLKSSTTNDFTAGTTIETKSAVAAGEVVFTIPSPQNNLHYQLDFTLNNTTPNSKKGTNGVATVSKVVYTNN